MPSAKTCSTQSTTLPRTPGYRLLGEGNRPFCVSGALRFVIGRLPFPASAWSWLVLGLWHVVTVSGGSIHASWLFSYACSRHAFAFSLAPRRSVLRRTCPSRAGLLGAEAIPFSCASPRSP